MSAAAQRIAIVAPYYPPSTGGVQTYAAQTAALVLAGRGEVLVITTGPSRWRWRVERRSGETVVRLPVAVTVSNTPLHPLWPFMVWWWLSRHRIDLVITHAPVVGLADVARFVIGRRRLIATYHAGSMAKGENAGVDRMLIAYERWVLPRVFDRAERVVAVSPVALGARLRKSTIIPPGFRPDIFRPRPRPEPGPVVLFVGRMDRSSRWKGVDVLLDAAAVLRSSGTGLRVRLVGPGDAIPDLRLRAAELGIADDVEFLGARYGHELADLYRSAAVCVLPSTTSAESFGMTLLEAMACGTAVVGTHGTGAMHLVTDGVDGRLVPPADVTQLASVVKQLLTDPAQRRRLGEAASLAVHGRRSWDVVLDQWRRLIDGDRQPAGHSGAVTRPESRLPAPWSQVERGAGAPCGRPAEEPARR